MSKSQSLYLSLLNAKSPISDKSPDLKLEDGKYRLYIRGEQIDSKEKMNLLHEVYTSKLAAKTYEDLGFEEVNGGIRKPLGDLGALADYSNAKIHNITAFRNMCKVKATVPHGIDEIISYSEEIMEFLY